MAIINKLIRILI